MEICTFALHITTDTSATSQLRIRLKTLKSKNRISKIWGCTSVLGRYKSPLMLCCFVGYTATNVSKVWLYAFIDILYLFKVQTTQSDYAQSLDDVNNPWAQMFSKPSPGLLFCCPRFWALLYKGNCYCYKWQIIPFQQIICLADNSSSAVTSWHIRVSWYGIWRVIFSQTTWDRWLLSKERPTWCHFLYFFT